MTRIYLFYLKYLQAIVAFNIYFGIRHETQYFEECVGAIKKIWPRLRRLSDHDGERWSFVMAFDNKHPKKMDSK